MKKIIYLFALIFLFSCTPQKRLLHLIEKYPYLKSIDTIKISDTTIRPGIKTDTAFKLIPGKHDTFYFYKDK